MLVGLRVELSQCQLCCWCCLKSRPVFWTRSCRRLAKLKRRPAASYGGRGLLQTRVKRQHTHRPGPSGLDPVALHPLTTFSAVAPTAEAASPSSSLAAKRWMYKTDRPMVIQVQDAPKLQERSTQTINVDLQDIGEVHEHVCGLLPTTHDVQDKRRRHVKFCGPA